MVVRVTYAIAVLVSAGCLVVALMRAGDGHADTLTTALWMAGVTGTVSTPLCLICWTTKGGPLDE
jgi:hypothetical protein